MFLVFFVLPFAVASVLMQLIAAVLSMTQPEPQPWWPKRLWRYWRDSERSTRLVIVTRVVGVCLGSLLLLVCIPKRLPYPANLWIWCLLGLLYFEVRWLGSITADEEAINPRDGHHSISSRLADIAAPYVIAFLLAAAIAIGFRRVWPETSWFFILTFSVQIIAGTAGCLETQICLSLRNTIRKKPKLTYIPRQPLALKRLIRRTVIVIVFGALVIAGALSR